MGKISSAAKAVVHSLRNLEDLTKQLGETAARTERAFAHSRLTDARGTVAVPVDHHKIATAALLREQARRTRLAFDPDVQKIRPAERATALRIEADRHVKLQRAEKGSGVDFVDESGVTYDAVGSGLPAEHFDKQWPRFQETIVEHLEKSYYVPVDVSTLKPDQVQKVEQFVETLGERVFLVGKN